MRYDPAEIANAGVFVTIDSNGSLIAERGYVRPEDEAPIASDRDDDTTSVDWRRTDTGRMLSDLSSSPLAASLSPRRKKRKTASSRCPNAW